VRADIAPEPRIDRLHDAFEIARELRIVVVGRLDRDVLAVIAEVEHQHVVARREELPERQIGVRREPIAVGDDQAHPGAIAVAPHADFGTILQIDVEALARHWNDQIHQPALFPIVKRSAHGSCVAALCGLPAMRRHL
jgi:hypothetical protein